MEERISRSEQKRQFRQIEAVAGELSELSDPELKRLPGSAELKAEILLCRKTKAGAKKRQIKYIAKMLHNEKREDILCFLQEKKGSKLEENQFQHEVERLRDRIVDDALLAYETYRQNQDKWDLDWQSEAIAQALHRYPDLDERELRSAAHQYARNRGKTYYRELFRMVKAAAEKKRLNEKKEQSDDKAADSGETSIKG